MHRDSWFESLTERLFVAIVSAIACALTLALFPIVIAMIGRGGGGGEFEFGVLVYSFVFSKSGLLVVIGGAVVGFCVGSERMANIFSFFWGTHSFWDKAREFLDDKLSVLQTEHNAPTWLVVILLVALASFFLLNYAKP
jgi:hypothetical protein